MSLHKGNSQCWDCVKWLNLKCFFSLFAFIWRFATVGLGWICDENGRKSGALRPVLQVIPSIETPFIWCIVYPHQIFHASFIPFLFSGRHYWKNSIVRPQCNFECKKRILCDAKSGRSHDRKHFCAEVESKIDDYSNKGWRSWFYHGFSVSYVFDELFQKTSQESGWGKHQIFCYNNLTML